MITTTPTIQRIRVVATVAHTTLLVAVLATFVGCAGGARHRTDAASAADGLVSLRVEWRDNEENRGTLHEIRRDGTIAFGGGFDAASGRTTWSGALTEEDRAEIVGLLRSDGWLTRSVTGAGDPATLRGNVRITMGDGTHRHRIRGASPELDRLRDALERASAARFDNVMRTLPEAGERVR